MIKFDFNIWNQQNSLEQNNDDLPLFIDINNLFIKNKNTLNTSKILALFWYMRYNPWVNTLNTSNLKLIVERVFFMRLIGRKIFEEN